MPLLRYIPILWFVLILSTACTSQKTAYEAQTIAQLPSTLQTGDRKILYDAFLTLSVEEPDSIGQYIQVIAKRYGGYANEIGTYLAVIRVESQQLEAAIESISTLGRLDRKSIRGQDMTEVFLDYQIRLDNAQQARTRYLDLLGRAQTVDEILKVEKELERLNETIDLLKGKINRIDHLDTYATITINLKARQKPGILGYIGIGLYRGMRWLFVRG